MPEKKIELKVGDLAPDFCLPDKDSTEVCLKDFKEKYTVVYFYPKDNTPGCTTEAIGFTGIFIVLADFGFYPLSIKELSRCSDSIGTFYGQILLMRILF
ncbi:MAG: redoxin domain-containing protein, partial [Candidatus Lokiarchaeia archaeon]|nr:redoxin domain-containing protein [Candidatus Lokiarchaeia archaeon]